MTISSAIIDEECTIYDDKSVTFCGTYKKISFDADDRSILFLGSGNTLYYPQAEDSIGAQRAYLQLTGLTAGDKADGIRAFVLNFGDGEASGIVNAEANSSLFTLHSSLQTGWYTLDGRRIGDKPTTKGLYIHNGRKVLIK